jgi:hypothetical protein
MKTKAEVIARLADRAYHNYMDGAWFMMSGVDTELAAWILGEDSGDFYAEVVAAAEALLTERNKDQK